MDRSTVLERAAAWRERRDRMCAQLDDGRLTLQDVLAARHDDPPVGEVKLLTVLEALPGARKVATRRMLADLGLGERLRLREIDDELAARVLETFPLSSAGTDGAT